VTTQYAEWIKAYVDRTPHLLGRCKDAVDEMHAAFPELRPAKGYAQTLSWGERDHWWLVAENGAIVDPTEAQFPGGIFHYREWLPGSLTRVGKCMDCGEYIWRCADTLEAATVTFCDEDCAARFERFM